MNDKFTDDLGNEITCSNCDTTARDLYHDDETLPSNWFVGSTWYCSDECYGEATSDEG